MPDPDVIERAAAKMASTFSKLRPVNSTIDEEETAWERAMRDAIRVVLAEAADYWVGRGDCDMTHADAIRLYASDKCKVDLTKPEDGA